MYEFLGLPKARTVTITVSPWLPLDFAENKHVSVGNPYTIYTGWPSQQCMYVVCAYTANTLALTA